MRPPKSYQGLFESTGSIVPGRSAFDLSYEKKMTCDMGQLIPVMCDEVVPGDVFNIGNEAVVRFQPLVAPIMHEVNIYFHYFFVPYRLLWSTWETFITGGKDGTDNSTLPRWSPSNTAVGSLWDFLGFPVGIVPTGALPMAFPKYAYNFIYNNYYRDENLITELDITANENILKRAWEKDYFTSALPWQQRGTAPALPISGTVSADFSGMSDTDILTYIVGSYTSQMRSTVSSPTLTAQRADGSNLPVNANLVARIQTATKNALTAGNSINLASATTFNVADLRLAFQIQRWMERNARAGARYTEFLKAHFGVSPRDDRLQRPEYIGGTKAPVIISEVLKTSSDGTTPQGTMAGHGLSASRDYCCKYHAEEYGLIMGIMSIMPRTGYSQGVDRQWLRTTRYDFYSPEFAHLSEQAIIRAEIYADGVQANNQAIFGYQGRYDEMRCKRNMFVSQMRVGQAFDYWHLGRSFGSAPALNQTFVECDPAKRIFAVPSAPGLIVNVLNGIRALRPMPAIAEPGLIDHD